jgi:hypothetical protein
VPGKTWLTVPCNSIASYFATGCILMEFSRAARNPILAMVVRGETQEEVGEPD